ncbi:MAG: Nre family DNA repair protein [Fervidicoccaceae archaeon]
MVKEVELDARLCLLCRGGRYLCGLVYCPVLARSSIYRGLSRVEGARELWGSSPPTIFVGRAGYPRVRAGLGAPPVEGDTSVYESPEAWTALPLERVLEFRVGLVLGYELVDVHGGSSRILDELRELALSSRPVDVEMEFARPLRPRVLLDEHVPPMGPGSPLRRLRLASNPSVPRVVERVSSDVDLDAEEALVELYENGVHVSYIQRLLSAGCLGGRSRRLVPTRWSITAVDDVISRALLREISSSPSIDEYEVFHLEHSKNLFVALLAPGAWAFEWMEAWYPGSTWNPASSGEPAIEGDHEFHWGRRTYASIGGCYYAARLAAAEHLARRGRRATVVLLREIYPGFDVPIGVWFVRESLRKMFSSSAPERFSSLDEALARVAELSRLGLNRWLARSRLLEALRAQRRLDAWTAPTR